MLRPLKGPLLRLSTEAIATAPFRWLAGQPLVRQRSAAEYFRSMYDAHLFASPPSAAARATTRSKSTKRTRSWSPGRTIDRRKSSMVEHPYRLRRLCSERLAEGPPESPEGRAATVIATR